LKTAPWGSRFFRNSNFSAATIGSVSLLNADYDNFGQSFGVFARDIGSGKEIKWVKHTDKADKANSWKWSPEDGKLYTKTDLTLAVLGADVDLGGPADIAVSQNGTALTDGQTDAVEFGTLGQYSAAAVLTFTVANSGAETLMLGDVSLLNNTGFEIFQQPAETTLPAGESTTFQLRLPTNILGDKYADVAIASSDGDENPFEFPVSGTVIPVAPEIEVTWEGYDIADSDPYPVDVGWAFEGEDALETTFVVNNVGAQSLTLDPIVLNSNVGFEIVQQPDATVAPGGSTSFILRVPTDSPGNKHAQVELGNSDADEDPYDFYVEASVIKKEPQVQVMRVNLNIINGQSSPIDFGEAAKGTEPVYVTFRLRNTGTDTLTFGNIVLNDNIGFEVTGQPQGPLEPFGETTFVVRMLTDTVGQKSAEVWFENNDAEDNPFNFNIVGEVTMAPELTYSVTNLGSGLYGYTFTVLGNDEELASFFADVTFTGSNGGQIQQVQGFVAALGDTEPRAIDKEADALAYDQLDPDYDMTLDSYFLEPFSSGNVLTIEQGANSYRIVAGTQPGEAHADAELAYIVCTGELSFSGTVSRLGENYPISGVATPL